MKYSVEIVYPAPVFEELEALLKTLAASHGDHHSDGRISTMGGFAKRQLVFRFGFQQQAAMFAAQCSFIAGIRVAETEPMAEIAA